MIERTYFEDENLVVTVISGKLTASELRQHVIELNVMFEDKAGVNELADCRFLTDVSELKAPDAASSAEMQKGQKRALGSKGAIVVASDVVYGLARAYAMFSQDSRDDSQVFRSIDEAIEWLGVDHLGEKIKTLSDNKRAGA